MKHKLAQMEALGLVIIVFLMALGIFFMLTVSTENTKKALQINPQNANLAQNMVDAIKNIKLECPGTFIKRKVELSELISDLAYQHSLRCNSTSSIEYTEDAIGNILNETLVRWGKPFVFRITEGSHDYIRITTLGCSESSPGNQGYQPFPLPHNVGTVEMKLFICN